MSRERLSARVIGRVQGVGYRWWARRQAAELDLVGWVMNADDERSVELVAEGDPEALSELERRLGEPSQGVGHVGISGQPYRPERQRVDEQGRAMRSHQLVPARPPRRVEQPAKVRERIVAMLGLIGAPHTPQHVHRVEKGERPAMGGTEDERAAGAQNAEHLVE